MTQIHTHYDNLKVARNAPPEVIRAAYRTLSQKYHPDRNPDNAEAARIMSIINTSYEVLSDPSKRQEHDLWVVQQERPSAQSPNLKGPSWSTQQKRSDSANHPKVSSDRKTNHIFRYWFVYGLAAVFIWMWTTEKPSTSPSGLTPYQASQPPSESEPYQASPPPLFQTQYVKPNKAPNGQPWPTSADYVEGYQRLHNDGLSSVTVDNRQNNSNVFVKLVSLNSAQAYPVRQFFIPALSSFTLDKLTAGRYDIRYRDLGNGGLSRSEAFSLEEISTYNGTQFSNITMTLYKVQDGNMQTYGLSETEF